MILGLHTSGLYTRFCRPFFQLDTSSMHCPISQIPEFNIFLRISSFHESSFMLWHLGTGGSLVSNPVIIDQMQAFKLKNFQKFSILETFILEAPFSYYPRMEKREDAKGGLPSKY